MSNPALTRIMANATRISKFYEEDPRTQTFNAIIYGPPKVGKTHIIRTCPGPILVHSFDPGGTIVLEDDIKSGKTIVDTRFEVDDPLAPKAFLMWEKEMNQLIKDRFFDHVGTYVLDSMTTWSQCIMYEVIKKGAIASKGKRKVGGHPRKQDWMPQMSDIENWMRKFVGLPCNCVLLGHDDLPTNEDGEPIDDRRLMITGKLSKKVPALFDEVYYMGIKNTVTGERSLQTQPKNRVSAGSRLGRGGKLDTFEEPDITKILKKVGRPFADKPFFKDLIDTTDEAIG